MKRLIVLSVISILSCSACKTGHHHELHSHEAEVQSHENGRHGIEASYECSEHDIHDSKKHYHEAGTRHEAHSSEIVLSPEAAQRAGVESIIVEPSAFSAAIRCSGKLSASPSQTQRILASSSGIITWQGGEPTLGSKVAKGQVIANISTKSEGQATNAQITHNAAKKEYERAKALYEQQLISEKEFLLAQRDYNLALNAYEGMSISAPQSGYYSSILAPQGSYVEQYSPIAIINCNKGLRLEAKLPASQAAKLEQISSAIFKVDYSEQTYTSSKLLSAAQSIEAGYIPLIFETDADILPESYADIWLITNTKEQTIALPITALVEEQGEFFVYIQEDEDCYYKQVVKLGSRNASEVEILQGIEIGQRVVSKGAYQVKLASASVIPGHTHNH